jgi:transmembrane sensor
MSDERGGKFPGSPMREDAAHWFARMRGPDAVKDRADFEAWLAASPLHRDAYNRITEVFSLGKGLKQQTAAGIAELPSETSTSRGAWVTAILALVIVIAGGGAWSVSRHRDTDGPRSGGIVGQDRVLNAAAYATKIGQIHQYRLSDGSSITLDTDSQIAVAFDGATRALQLLRGRARFNVAHEPRPFIVTAGAGTVTAHGTLFDIRLQAHNAVSVRLLRGAIDVALPGPAGVLRHAMLRERLLPGQQLVFDASALTRPRLAPTPVDARWPEATLDCDHQFLSSVVTEANRYATTQIELADAPIGNLRVSGSFRIDEPDILAERLATLFDLRVDKSVPGRLVLRQN